MNIGTAATYVPVDGMHGFLPARDAAFDQVRWTSKPPNARTFVSSSYSQESSHNHLIMGAHLTHMPKTRIQQRLTSRPKPMR